MNHLATAFHEAGHAVAAWQVTMRPPDLTSIVAEIDSNGRVVYSNPLAKVRLEFDSTPRAQRRAENAIIISLAGPIAQRQAYPRSLRKWHTSSDYQQAADVALSVCGSSESAIAFLKWLEIRSRNLIQSRWSSIETLAGALLEKKQIRAPEFMAMILPKRDYTLLLE